MYSGPYLVLKCLGPVNLRIQRTRRAKPLIVHVDKVKPYYGEPPTSWLKTAEVNSDDTASTLEAPPGPNPVQPPSEIAGSTEQVNIHQERDISQTVEDERTCQVNPEEADGITQRDTEAVASAAAEEGPSHSIGSTECDKPIRRPRRKINKPKRYMQ